MAPKARGHRQRGAGTVTVSRGEQLRQGVMCKEWQRTPVQLLHEYCQSKKRASAQYRRVRATGGGDKFRMRCVLPDDKNSAKDLAFCPEQSFDSMDEAKHCAALLALKYVEPLRPHERKLPDPYRDLWLSLGKDSANSTAASNAGASAPNATTNAKSKKKDAKAAYAAPASTQPSEPVKKREENGADGGGMDFWAAAGDEEDADDASKKNKKKTLPLELSSDRKFASQAEFDQARREKTEERNRRQRARENRERANIPKSVMMSAACREQIERVLRDLGSITAPTGGSGSDDDDGGSDNAMASSLDTDTAKVANKLRAVGFQEKHCADAFRKCPPDAATSTDADYFTKVLDWLCLNVPETELPKQFNPEGTQLDVVLATNNSTAASSTLSGLSAVLVQRLMKFGYDRSDAIQVTNEFLRDHSKGVKDEETPTLATMLVLLESLFPKVKKHFDVGEDLLPSSDEIPDEAEILAMRQDEIFALEAIYDDKLQIQAIDGEETATGSSSQLLLIEATDGVKVHIFLPASSKYPFEMPLLAVTSPSGDHQPYLLAACGHALQSCKMSIGEPMLYDLFVAVDSLIQDPAALRKQPTKIQLFAPPAPPQSKQTAPPPAPTRITEEMKSTSQRKSKKRQQGSNRRTNVLRGINREATRRLSEMLKSRRYEKESDKGFQQMLKTRTTLPAHKEKENVLRCVRDNQVVLVCGQTGCGKTTQVPQFILDEYIDRGAGGECQIVCTQPRRIAAIGVATRVAQERCEQIADVVGYQIRMDAKKSANTRLLFCTTGVLLRRLLTDRALSGVTHVIVDEVHERNIDTDFLLSVLRDLLPHRPDLRVILMSATMNAELFVKYFSVPARPPCPVLDIPGFTFPVECHFLEDIVGMTHYEIPKKLLKKSKHNAADKSGDEDAEKSAPARKETSAELVARMDDSRIDYDLCLHLVTHLLTSATPRHEGAILIFLPGTAEIKRLMEMLNHSSVISSHIWVLALHGSLSGADQSLVFKPAPPGKTKIIVSTNIAETSITINDITVVVDCGKVKEMVYDNQQRRSQLLDCWASRAACDQRKGRAGRVQSGTCYRLFSRKRFDSMSAQLAAEIHRVSLEQLCLQIKKLELGSIRGFLAKAIEPPREEAVTAAVQELVDIAAFQPAEDQEDGARSSKKKAKTASGDEEEVVLTPLGSHLAMLPLDARIGKFLVYGSILRCVEPVAIIAACISSKNPFVMSMSDPELREKQEAFKKELGAANWKSDHLLLWKLIERYAATARGQKLKRAFCRDYGLSYDTLETILDLKAQYLQQLDAIGFYDAARAEHLNENASVPRIIKAALCAGLYANVVKVVYPEQKYFQSAHGAFTEAHDAKKIRYFIRQREEQESAAASSFNGRPRDERVFLHPSSSNFTQTQYDSPWLLYTELVQTSKLFVRESTMVNPYALLLFGGRVDVAHDRGLLTIDGWISFHAVARIGVLIKAIRQHLDRLLRAKIEDPDVDIARSELVTAISHLLKSEGM